MRRTLLLTNDFPPRVGGIQSYVHALASRLPAGDLVVLASDYPGAAEFDAAQPFPVTRYPSGMLLPTPAVARCATELIAAHRLTAVWYGAAAPLGLLTPSLRRQGVQRTVACTYGHEVGWSMLPGARRALRRIGTRNDVLTFISRYARRRISPALGPMTALEYLPPGVDADDFRPDPERRISMRRRYRLGDAPVLVCVSRLVPRKGQDMLIGAMPEVTNRVPGAKLLIVGDGPYADSLRRQASASPAGHAVIFTGPVPHAELPAHYASGDVFAMPCRTRGGGLDVEGLGIVFLEASAAGLPVIAGDSGGAPEAVLPEQTGVVVDGRDRRRIADSAIRLLSDPGLRARWGEAGRRWVRTDWNWRSAADKLAALLDG